MCVKNCLILRAAGLDGVVDELADTLRTLAPRSFVVRDAHITTVPILVQPRYAMSPLRGPMTRVEIRPARGVKCEPIEHPEEPRAPNLKRSFA
jgi:hypothetical protein